MKLLVADDNRANRLIARAVLERECHEVSLAASGLDAVDLAIVRPFDAVLLDILMPVMDGMRTIRKLKAAHQALPVFALTSYDTPADVSRYLEAGFDGVIPKPLNPGDFGRAYALYCEGAPAVLSGRNAEKPDIDRLPLLDLKIIQAGAGRAGRDAGQTVLQHYRNSVTTLVRTLQQTLPGAVGHDPVDLRAFRDALHGLKSASAMIGMSRMPAIAGHLRNAPPKELRRGVAKLIQTLKVSLPELEYALAHASAGEQSALVPLRVSRSSEGPIRHAGERRASARNRP